MHNYTLQCFGTIAALTNDKGAGIWAGPLSAGSYVGPILIPDCIKSLDLNGMEIELLYNYHVKFSRGAFYCTLVGLTIDDEPGDLSEEGYMPSNLSYKDRQSKKYFVYFDPPKPAPGAELLKLVPASHKKWAKFEESEQRVSAAGLTISKKQVLGFHMSSRLESVNYWGAVEPLRGLVKPFNKGSTTVRIDFDGRPMVVSYDNAKLIEKLSKKATFGHCNDGLMAHFDGYLYYFGELHAPSYQPYITLSLNTTMEQVA